MLGFLAPLQNSLRSLRSLRSDTCNESDHEARCCARPGTLRFSAAPIRPAQAPPAALPATVSVFDVPPATTGPATGHPGRDQRASEAPSSTGFGARARSALRDLTRRACSTTVSAANGGSCATGPRTRAAQGSRSAAKTASAKRWALPGCPVAAPPPAKRNIQRPQRDDTRPRQAQVVHFRSRGCRQACAPSGPSRTGPRAGGRRRRRTAAAASAVPRRRASPRPARAG